MRHALPTVLIALTLAACGDGEVALNNATPEEVAKQVEAAGGVRFKPGKWETVVQTVSVDIPGLEGATKRQLTDTMLKQARAQTSCITARQAKSPPAEVIARSQGSCRFEKFAMDDGVIDGTLACPAGNTGQAMKMRVVGTFDESSFAIESDAEATAANRAVLRFKAKTSGRRVGDCSPEEERKADGEKAA